VADPRDYDAAMVPRTHWKHFAFQPECTVSGNWQSGEEECPRMTRICANEELKSGDFEEDWILNPFALIRAIRGHSLRSHRVADPRDCDAADGPSDALEAFCLPTCMHRIGDLAVGRRRLPANDANMRE
jgi:hypothetical protein